MGNETPERTPRKSGDPRYVPDVSEHDDDMTDAEWFWAMGPVPQDWQDER